MPKFISDADMIKLEGENIRQDGNKKASCISDEERKRIEND